MWEFETNVSEIIQRTPTIKSFRFLTEAKNVHYQSGQFFFVTIKSDEQELLHHVSFSSSPTEAGYIEFTKKITASEFSQSLAMMQPGAWMRLRGPEGEFVLPKKPTRLAFICGGIGITPVRSMLRYIADKNLAHDAVLIYSNSSFEEIAFREELDALSATHPNIRVEHVLGGPDLPSDWKGKVGTINKDMLADLVPDYENWRFYVCGPPRIVQLAEDQLIALGVPGDTIKKDYFTGYN